MILAPVLRQMFGYTNVNLVGGSLLSYVAGTTTPQATYTDETGATPNTNPVVLDSNGSAAVWIDPSLSYKFVLNDVNGNLIFTADQVSASGGGGVTLWNEATNYSEGDIVADSSGYGLLYVSVTDNNIGNPLTSISNWRMLGGAIRTVTTNTTLEITDELLRSNSTSGSLTHTLPPCSTTPIGKRMVVKDVGTGGNSTTIQGSGIDQIDGANVYPGPLRQYNSIEVENTGSNWDVI